MDDYDKEMLKGMAKVIGGIVVFTALLMIPLHRWGVTSRINKFNASRATVERARGNPHLGIESAALAHKIVEANRWLANSQYWNSVWWADVYIPDAVDDLKPIE